MENLIRLSDIMNSEAVIRQSGKKYDCIDILLTHNGGISSLTVSGQGLFGIKHTVPAHSIEKIEKNKVIVKKAVRAKRKREKTTKLFSYKSLTGKNIITERNEEIGRLSDMYFGPEKGRIVAVEASKSLFEDLFTGRMIIPGNILSFDRTSVYISTEQLENSLNNTKGIINVIDSALY